MNITALANIIFIILIGFNALSLAFAKEEHVSQQTAGEQNFSSLIHSAKENLTSNSEFSQQLATKAYQLAKTNKNSHQQVQALMLLTTLAKQKNKRYLVQKYLTDAETLAVELNNDKLLMQTYAQISDVAASLNNYQSSLAYSDKYLRIAKRLQDNQQLYFAYRQKALSLKAGKQYKNSLANFLNAQKYTKNLNAKLQFQAFYELNEIYDRLNDHHARIKYLTKAIEILKSSKNEKELPNTIIQLAKSHRGLAQYETAVIVANDALSLARSQNNPQMVAFASVVLSRVYRQLSSYEQALKHNIEAVGIYKQLNDLNGFASAANAIGLLYKHLEQHENSIVYFEQVLALPSDKVRPKYLAAALRELAQHYHEKGQLKKGMVLIRQSNQLYQKIRSVKGTASTKKIMGGFYQDVNDVDSALAAYKEALESSKIIRDSWSEAELLIKLGVLKIDTSLIEAKEFALQGLKIAERIKSKHVIEHAYSALIEIEEKLDNYQDALIYSKLKEEIRTEIQQEETRKRSAEFHILNNLKNKSVN